VISGVKMMAEMGTHPDEVAKAVIKAINAQEPLPRYVVGGNRTRAGTSDWQGIIMVAEEPFKGCARGGELFPQPLFFLFTHGDKGASNLRVFL